MTDNTRDALERLIESQRRLQIAADGEQPEWEAAVANEKEAWANARAALASSDPGSPHQHPLYDCGGKGHGSNANEVQWCHDCTPHPTDPGSPSDGGLKANHVNRGSCWCGLVHDGPRYPAQDASPDDRYWQGFEDGERAARLSGSPSESEG